MTEQEKYLAYLRALKGRFQKLCRLRFLNPDGSTAFFVDNNPRNKYSGAFVADGGLTVNLQNGVRRTASVTLGNVDGAFDYNVNHLWFGQEIALDEGLSPAEKLKTVQALAEGGDERVKDIFRTIGAYLAHTVPLYEMTYDIRHLIVLGRVASGVGGELIVGECCRILREEYPALAQKVQVMLPDEKFRRVGQSMAAASLPEV